MAAFAPGAARLQILAGVFYGLATARNSKSDYQENEQLLQDALDVLTVAGDLPAMLAGDANAMSRALNKSVQRAGLRQELARQRHFQKPTKLKFMANKNKHYFRMKRELNAILRTMEKRPQSRARVRRRQPDDAARQKAAFTPYRRPKAV